MKPLAIRIHNRWTWLFIGALLFFMPMLSFATAAPPGPDEIVLSLADDGRQAELGEGQVLVIALEANPSTGYGWQVEASDETLLRQIDARFEPTSNLLGAPGKQVFRFGAVKAGQTTLKLAYRRPWEKDASPVKTFAVRVQSGGVFKLTSLPTATPKVKQDLAPFDNSVLSLPASYNWCNLGGCTPVKNQGDCGSCWAFGTVGPLEANIKMWDAQTRDLAEQYLVSCASEYNGCNGGWFAHDYHEWKIPAGELAAGSVYEANFPYQAKDSSQGVGCNYTPSYTQPHPHHEKIATWAEVDPGASIPAVSDIKQAIYEHGPVGAAICVSSAFGGYITGTFQTDESAACDGGVNHAIVLVGWDDGRQAWRLRNSWGSGWGDGGYMWIRWGTSNVGLGANYVVYGVPSNLMASASSNRINLAWSDNSLAESGFKVERSANGTGNWTQVITVGANTTAYTDTNVTCSTTYYYRVRAYTASADSSYSNVASAQACVTAPSAPGSLNAASASATQINLTWTDNSDNETGFKIDRSPDGTSNWTAIYTTTVNATSYANTGLTCDTAFYYRVRAFNAGGDSGYSNTTFTTTASCASCADAYETDNDYSTANFFTVNGGAQTHNLHIAGDQDWVEFSATAGRVYTITTSNLGDDNDTYLELYDTNGSSRLAYDDDSGGNYSSKIVWTAPASGTYYVKVRHYSNQGGCTGYEYDLDVTESSSGCADAYEPDSVYASAKSIAVNGAAQAHNLHAAGDQDWAKFTATASQTYTIMTSNLDNGNDTVLELYSTDGATMLMLNDDCPGMGTASCINDWTAPSSSIYYVKAREYYSDHGGCAGYNYNLGVLTSGGSKVYLPLAARNTSNARTPNDSHYSYQWGLPQVNAPAAWGQSTGAGVTIAVVDTGVDLNHPDLAGKIVSGWDFVNGNSTPQDDHGHGTHVAGIAAATTNNSLGVAGLGWDAKVMPVKVLDSEGSGYDSDVAEGITWAVNHGARVINLSLSGEGWSQTLQDATDYAFSHGALVVAAAGNCGDPTNYPCVNYNPVIYPAANPNVLAVGATTSSDIRASFSEYGYFVDVTAPGYSIYSTVWNDTYTSMSGTSMASPLVAGLASLVWARKPTLSNAQVANVIMSTAHDLGPSGRDDQYGYGRVDAAAAVSAASSLAIPAAAEKTIRPVMRAPADAPVRPGVVLVRWKPGALAADRQSVLSRHGLRVAGQIEAIGVLKLSAPVGQEREIAAQLAADPGVEFAEPDYSVWLIQVERAGGGD